MGQGLTEIAQQLKDANKKVQLIYAFNGGGKTRLSREFKELVAPKNGEGVEEEDGDRSRSKILYYNAFTEDLFYWDNDLENDEEPKLKVQPNTFTDWVIGLLKELGEDGNIIANFQRYSKTRVNPVFNDEYKKKGIDYEGNEIDIVVPAYSEVIFQAPSKRLDDSTNLDSPDDDAKVKGNYDQIKISKGEESNFVWSVIYALQQQAVFALDEPDITNRTTNEFDQLEYIFIDDPVSSLDDSHLIELAIDLARLVKSSESKLKFIITTHSPLFYNVLWNEFNNDYYKEYLDGNRKRIYRRGESEKYRLNKKLDGTFDLESSNDHPFSYHLFLLSELKGAINGGKIEKYHFTFLRNVLEKTATFLGCKRWEELLEKTVEGQRDPIVNRKLNLFSHSAHSGEEVADISDDDKKDLEDLVKYLIEAYGFKEQGEQHG